MNIGITKEELKTAIIGMNIYTHHCQSMIDNMQSGEFKKDNGYTYSANEVKVAFMLRNDADSLKQKLIKLLAISQK